MSYEGYVQMWCSQGHLTHADAHEAEPKRCPTCRSKIVFSNPVDDTNCESYGYIEPVVATPAETCTCDCDNTHVVKRITYQIPDEKTVVRTWIPSHDGKTREPLPTD